MLSSRERVTLALNHKQTDRVPFDLGGSNTSGVHATIVYKLRQHFGLDEPGTPVKVIEPYQMLGEVEPDLQEALGVDVVPLRGTGTMFGFKKENWKPWTTFDGTPVLVPGGFNTDPAPNGDILMYPEGDKSVPPTGRMPKGGWYFDAIAHQEPIDDDDLKLEDNLEEFVPIKDEELEHFRREADRLYNETDKAILADFGGTSFGDIAMVPAAWLKHPKGIRGIEEWYISTVTRTDFIYEIFAYQCEVGLKNLEKLYNVVGDKATAIFVTGTDFGTQNAPFIAPQLYRDLFQPFHIKINNWIHKNTPWKSWIHSCGSVRLLIPDFIAAGFDILNPVQTSAANMAPNELKNEYGDRLTFWGGGVETQRTFPFGTPDEVRREVCERIETFGRGGGYVFNTIHNVQANVPFENVLAMVETVRAHRWN
ncbi:MAG: uroporphyrinogen decarboxylase family protein [Caldilineaceae bacterium]